MYGKYQTTYEGLFSGGIRIDDLMENGGSNRPKNGLINEWEKNGSVVPRKHFMKEKKKQMG